MILTKQKVILKPYSLKFCETITNYNRKKKE